jgi:septum site-determining protein MinD
MGIVIVITSGKGGVGKTTSTANIGAGLAMLGKSVVMIDTDIGLRNLDVVLGLENRIVYDIVDVVRGNCRLKQALIKDKRLTDMFLLPAAQTKDKTAVSEEQMISLCDELKAQYDYVIIDCPAGIEHGFKNAIAGAEEAIVITTPEVSAVRDADRIIGLLEAAEMPPPKLVVNRIRTSMVKSGDMMSVDDMMEILAIDLLGIVPDDDIIVISTNKGEPAVLNENSRAGIAYRNISRRICGEEVPLMDLEEKVSLWGRLKTFLARN